MKIMTLHRNIMSSHYFIIILGARGKQIAAPGAPRAFVLGGARAEPVREAEDRPDESRHHLKIMLFHEFQMKNGWVRGFYYTSIERDTLVV